MNMNNIATTAPKALIHDRYIPAGHYTVSVEGLYLYEFPQFPMFRAEFRILEGEYQNYCIALESYAFKGEYEEHMKNFLRSLFSDQWIDYSNREEFIQLLQDVASVVDGFIYEFDYKPCMCQNNFQLVNLVYKGHVDYEER